jgi:hypothetical protein
MGVCDLRKRVIPLVVEGERRGGAVEKEFNLHQRLWSWSSTWVDRSIGNGGRTCKGFVPGHGIHEQTFRVIPDTASLEVEV